MLGQWALRSWNFLYTCYMTSGFEGEKGEQDEEDGGKEGKEGGWGGGLTYTTHKDTTMCYIFPGP